jgi:hypothetical protein
MRFEEEQRFSGGWLWFWAGIVVLPAAILVVILFIDVAANDRDLTQVLPYLAMVAGIDLLLLALLWFFVRQPLITRVTAEGIQVRFPPFAREEIPAADIVAVELVPNGLFRQHGGGMGRRHGDRRARFTVGNDAGVVIQRTNGWRVVIGSKRPEELASAIRDLILPRPPTSK